MKLLSNQHYTELTEIACKLERIALKYDAETFSKLIDARDLIVRTQHLHDERRQKNNIGYDDTSDNISKGF